jgi:hypothetical protein
MDGTKATVKPVAKAVKLADKATISKAARAAKLDTKKSLRYRQKQKHEGKKITGFSRRSFEMVQERDEDAGEGSGGAAGAALEEAMLSNVREGWLGTV